MHHGLSQMSYVTDFMPCHVSDSYKKSVLLGHCVGTTGRMFYCGAKAEQGRGSGGWPSPAALIPWEKAVWWGQGSWELTKGVSA